MQWWQVLLIVLGSIFSLGFFVLLGFVIHFSLHFLDGW